MDKYPPLSPGNNDGQPFATYCPHCHAELKLQAYLAGQVINCPNCGGSFQAPVPQTSAPILTTQFDPAHRLDPGIKVCILISGIANILSGIFWIFTICGGAVIGVPQVVLAIFEIIYFTKADTKSFHDSLSQAKVLGILEIISGLVNLVSLVCGILVLVFCSNQAQQP